MGLHSVQMVDSKAVLPAGMCCFLYVFWINFHRTQSNNPIEIISTILDFLPVSDLFSFAGTSRRMREMVYDDTRWVQRLRSMGVWNEGEARRRFEEGLKRKWEAQKLRAEQERKAGIGVGVGVNGVRKTSTTIFDAGIEEEKMRRSTEVAKVVGKPGANGPVDGFETLSLSSSSPARQRDAVRASLQDPEAMLKVFEEVRSIRGSARQEYGRIYAAMAPFYYDLARSRSHTDPAIFRVYRAPEQQAQMLSMLQMFSRSDWAQGWRQREEKLNTMIGIFENAVLREFEQGYEAGDVEGRMNRYAYVLDVLNGGHAGVELFVQKHALFSDRIKLGHSMDCINQASAGGITLEPSREFFSILSKTINEQTIVIDKVFPRPSSVQQQLLEKVGEDIIGDYFTPLFDEAHERSIPSYLKAVSGIYEQSRQFAETLTPAKDSGPDFIRGVDEIMAKVFEPHVDLYLQEELDFFRREADSQVSTWEKKLSEQDATTESHLMANVNRQADKKDFLSSFKKVVMMPVNVLPSLPLGSAFGSTKTTTTTLEIPNGTSSALPTPTVSSPNLSRPHSPGLPDAQVPTNELAAKAAIMASRLEGIRSLFSIEIALVLVHAAKTSLERAQQFVKLGGQSGEEAREQCEQIFVVLLQILGSRHIQFGFDKAVDHLSKYNPREVSSHQSGVTPLVTFLELVNVGDLISQMIDVFYEQQLVASKIADKNDFLDPAVKAKKKFESMLDERVAAGLNKGIDVLIDEVEYLNSTLQLPTDYNPLPLTSPTSASSSNSQPLEIGPTPCATAIVNLVSSHTRLLLGSTDKSILDVFNQEVGLRLFTAICKHLKRQRISVDGSLRLISDTNIYYNYVVTLKNAELTVYFKALRELAQIYLIGPEDAGSIAQVVADGRRFGGVLRAEEVFEFAERRADWYTIKRSVERAMYGIGCGVM